MSEAQKLDPAEGISILEKINAALAELGSEDQWAKAPLFRPEYETLKNKKVLMIDDTFMVLGNILPELVVATGGNARAIHYIDQSLEELVARIMSENPDVLILDYHLTEDGLKGIDIARELKNSGFTGKIVGCSSDADVGKEFLGIGAVGNMNKTKLDAVKDLAAIVGRG